MNLLKISRGALEVREANSPLTEGELHLNTVFDKNTINTLDEFGQKPFISLHTKVKDEIKKIATDHCLAVTADAPRVLAAVPGVYDYGLQSQAASVCGAVAAKGQQ